MSLYTCFGFSHIGFPKCAKCKGQRGGPSTRRLFSVNRKPSAFWLGQGVAKVSACPEPFAFSTKLPDRPIFFAKSPISGLGWRLGLLCTRWPPPPFPRFPAPRQTNQRLTESPGTANFHDFRRKGPRCQFRLTLSFSFPTPFTQVPPGLLNRTPKSLHPLLEHGLGKLVCTAEDERAKILVPVALRGNGRGLYPCLKRHQVRYRNAPLFYSLQKVLPKRPRLISELNLRQSRPPRRSYGSDLCLPRFCVLHQSPPKIDRSPLSVLLAPLPLRALHVPPTPPGLGSSSNVVPWQCGARPPPVLPES